MEFTDLLWLLFILFFLYRIFAQGTRRGDEEEGAGEHTGYEERPSTQTRDEILRELQTIFRDDYEEPQSREHTPAPAESTESPRESERYAAYSGTRFIDTTTAEKEEDWNGPVLVSPGLEEEKEEKSDAFDFLLDFDQIRRGIIISEILQKPRSRRRA